MIAGVHDIATKEPFGDFQLHLEFMEPDLPNARVAQVEDAGHALALEAPDASAAAALEFLRADSVA